VRLVSARATPSITPVAPRQISASLYQNISRLLGRPAHTVEDVLNNATLRLADSAWRYQAQASSPEYADAYINLYQHRPALGFYCYYRKRPNETVGYLPDCPEADNVTQTHGAEMAAIGIGYVVTDATNWDADPRNASDGSDLNQLRPTEVLAENWLAMRTAGQMTPQLGVFDMVNTGCTEPCLWWWYLSELYSNRTYLDADMVWTDAASGLLVYMYVYNEETLNGAALRDIQRNLGNDNVLTVPNWVADSPDPSFFANGVWTYLTPCVTNGSVSGGPSLTFTNDNPIDLDVVRHLGGGGRV
jgi:hypothetical protein